MLRHLSREISQCSLQVQILFLIFSCLQKITYKNCLIHLVSKFWFSCFIKPYVHQFKILVLQNVFVIKNVISSFNKILNLRIYQLIVQYNQISQHQKASHHFPNIPHYMAYLLLHNFHLRRKLQYNFIHYLMKPE